jgi:predicted transport protein
LENWDNKNVVSFENLTIEHIVPCNPHLSVRWKAMLGRDGWRETQKRYLHSVGNLTLTAYNSEMSDSPFEDKLEMKGGFKESALRLNRYVVKQTTWGETQIRERATQLGEIAKNAWPYPTLSKDELSQYQKPDGSAQRYSIESYSILNADNRLLFEKLNTRIMNLSIFIEREFKKQYIAYKADTNFVCVMLQKACLRLTVNMKHADVADPKGICENLLNRGHHGTGDVGVTFESVDGLDDVMAIVEQAFNLQDVPDS